MTVRIERSAKRLRGYLAGDLVVDTTASRLVWEEPAYPTYYLPAADIRAELVEAGRDGRSGPLGVATVYDVRTAHGTASGAARRYGEAESAELHDLVRLAWDALDPWLEEDERVQTHPRDPHHRVEILASSRHVRIVAAGETVADSKHPTILLETGLVPRFYLPMSDVRLELLEPSDTVTHCPYKGDASYWSLRAAGERFEDAVWTYRTPLPESTKIAGLACFSTEKLELWLDGERQEALQPHPAPVSG